MLVPLAALTLPGAAAQQAGADTGELQKTERALGMLEEVVVTARRREELLQEIPIAVTAFDNQFLQEQNITEMSDLGVYIPSFRVSDGAPGTNNLIVTLRGQRPSDLGLTVDAAVPIYFAEVPLTPNQGTNLAMYDLSSVQVLKGPQGTLFGRNSTGGAMLLTPVEPGAEFGGYAQARAGNYDLLHFEGAVDLPVNDDLRFRVAGRSIDRDGYQDNVADNALNGDEQYWDEDSWGVRFSMNWTPTDRLENSLVVSYDENDMLGRVPVPQMYNNSVRLGILVDAVHNGGGLIPAPPPLAGDTRVTDAIERQAQRDDPTKIETDTRAGEKVENTLVSNITTFELSDNLSIKNVFGYRDLSWDNNNDADGTAVQLFGAFTSTTDAVTPNPRPSEFSADQYSEELQLLGESFDGQLEWIVGAFWMTLDGEQTDYQQFPGANPDWPAVGTGIPQIDAAATNGFKNIPDIEVENDAYAAFGEGTWTFNERWAFTGGIRQSWDDREMTVKSFQSSESDPAIINCVVKDEDGQLLSNDNCSRKVDEDFDKFTWRTALSYTPVDRMLLYGSVSTGYRTGGLNTRGTNNFSLQPFDEETVLVYELGHKTDWELANLAAMRTNLAVYFQDFDDIQKTLDGTNPETGVYETYTVNAADAEIWGVEFDVMVAPTTNLTFALGWSYVDTEYNEWDREVEPGVFVDYSDAPFVFTPEHSVTASANYVLPLDASIGEVSLNAFGYWQDDMDTVENAQLYPTLGWSDENLQAALETTEVDDYTVWNFSVDWRGVMGSDFDLSAWANNAFDEEYETGGLTVADSLGWVGFSYGAPRTFGATLRYSF